MNHLLILFAFIAISSLAPKAMAAITYSAFNSAQVSSADESNLASPILYGGTSGTCSSADPASTCDSCADSSYSLGLTKTCNTRRIHDTLVLRIEFKVDSLTGSGLPEMFDKEGTKLTLVGRSGTTAKDETAYVEVRWSEICTKMLASGTSCNDVAGQLNESFTVGIDADTNNSIDSNEGGALNIYLLDPSQKATANAGTINFCEATDSDFGICSFIAFPGDEKISILSPIPGDSFPTQSGVTYTGVRVFYSDISFNEAIPGKGTYKDIPIENGATSSDFFLKNKVIDGLTNLKTYYFRISMLDAANNVALVTSDDAIKTGAGCVNLGPTPAPVACAFSSTPDEVFGLLTEDLNCFISTAVYGSNMAPTVKLFREFRSRILLSNSWGKRLNQLYYEFGPYGARVIDQYPMLKPFARVLLAPLAYFADLSLKLGFVKAFSLGLFVLIAMGATFFLGLQFLKKKFRFFRISFFLVAFVFLAANFNSTSAFAQEHEEDDSPIVIDQEPLPLIKRNRETVPQLQSQPTKMYHPNAKKGLTRITKDRVYIYKTKTSPQDKAASLRFGLFSPTQLKNSNGVSFDQFYDSNAPALLGDYEWQLWRGSFGKLGLKVGSGLYVASGHGQFKNPSVNPGLTPVEKFTFVMFPNNVGAIYRMQFWDKQPLVPYAEGGVDALTFFETRDDGKSPKFGGAFAAHGALGASFSLNFLDQWTILELDKDYGINSIWLTAEYRIMQGLGGNFDFSGNIINAGFMAEF